MSARSVAERWSMVEAIVVADLITDPALVAGLLDVTPEQASRLVAGWKERVRHCPTCHQPYVVEA